MNTKLFSCILLCLFQCSLFAQSNLAVDSIHVNTISAKIYANGLMEEVNSPLGSLAKSQGIWLGAEDINGLRLSAQTEMGQRADFSPGPVSNDPNAATKYNKVYKVSVAEINSFINNPTIIPPSLAQWPGNGDITMGEAAQLAPYVDINGDAKYNPQDGDYPKIKGDVAVFVIFNDTNNRSSGDALGIEVHAMLYGFKTGGVEDSVLYREYTIYNRTNKLFANAHISTFVDFADNSLHGTNVSANAIFSYGRNVGSGQVTASGLRILENPYADYFDGRDNDKDGCPDGLRDPNGNCIAEDPAQERNERYLLATSMYYDKFSSNVNMRAPQTSLQFDNYMRLRWLDGNYMIPETPDGFKGINNGDGYIGMNNSSVGVFFHGNSFDTTGNNSPSSSSNWFQNPNSNKDLQTLAIAGPFSIEPNEIMTSKFAFSWTVGDTVNCGYDKINNQLNYLDTVFKNKPIRYVSVKTPVLLPRDFNIFFSAEKGTWHIQNTDSKTFEFSVFTLAGQLVKTIRVEGKGTHLIDLQNFPSGVYVLTDKTSGYTKKITK